MIGSTVLPQRYDAKSVPGSSSTRVVVTPSRRGRRPPASSRPAGPRVGARCSPTAMPPLPQRRQAGHGQPDGHRRRRRGPARRDAGPGRRRRRRGAARGRGTTSGTARGVLRRARPAVGAGRKRLERAPRAATASSYGWAPTAMSGADGDQGDEEGPVAPADERRGRRSAEHRDGEADGDQPEALGVVDGRLDPGAELVVAVEEPVAEAPQDLRATSEAWPRSRPSRCSGGRRCRSSPCTAQARRSTTASTATVSTPISAAVAIERPRPARPPMHPHGERRSRARARDRRSTRAVALTPPTVGTTSANSAGWRQPPRRRARSSGPTSHGSAAHGRRITEMRHGVVEDVGLSM